MWIHSIKLPLSSEILRDEDGFEISTKEKWLENIPASFADITRSDARTAYELGYDAEINITIMSCNYGGQRYLVDEATGDTYYVKRSYRPDKSSKIVLTCSRTEGDERWRL